MNSTVLLVDDDAGVLHALERLLRAHDYRPLTANSGGDGLRLMETHDIPVVFSDQRMPGMSGIEFLTQVRERWPQSVRLMLSASSDFDTASAAINRGEVYKFIAKPWDNDALIAQIRSAFERYEHNQRTDRFTRVFSSLNEAVLITDAKGRIQTVNPAFTALTGYSADEVLGAAIGQFLTEHRGGAGWWAVASTMGHWEGEISGRRKNGTEFSVWFTISAIPDAGGQPAQYMTLLTDITVQKETEQRLQHLADYDPLTGLPNRRQFHGCVVQALAALATESFALLFLDLDRFKAVNDSLGHAAGDRLLQAAAQRIRDAAGEKATLARLGGDEFALLLPVGGPQDAVMTAQSVVSAFARPLTVDTHDLFLTASIGIALAPRDGATPETLMQHADTALSRAKQQGGNRHELYAEGMSDAAHDRLSLETSLRGALEREEFLLYYQPQVDIVSGRVTGVEALLRWQRPDVGLVLPAEFITVLEETGLIVPVGKWVLRQACAEVRAWNEKGLPPLRVAVNISACQFRDPGLFDDIESALRESQLPAELLEIEITESAIMGDAESAVETLRRLRERGLAVSIDDFGTGYSSLAALKRFPLHALKIDRAFVCDVADNPADAEIVCAIIGLARGLKLAVVAEGVENETQCSFLLSSGCEIVQGFLFSAPRPLAVLKERIGPNGVWRHDAAAAAKTEAA